VIRFRVRQARADRPAADTRVSSEVAAFFVTLARVFRSHGPAEIFRSIRRRRRFLRLTASQSAAAAAQVSISGERRNFLARAVFSEMQNFPARR
jgi:hypothetical protein